MKSFADKFAVITGAASGIGRALAVALAAEGCHLALADLNEQGLKETQALLPAGVRSSLYPLDVADRQAVYAFADAVLQAHGPIDIVINNAGVAIANQTVAELSYEDFEWLMGINFWGMVYGSKAFLPYLLQRDAAWLVNISSLFGLIGFPTQSAYNASKFAIRGFTEALRQELHGSPLRVSCVHPGGIDTAIVANSRGFTDETARKEGMREFKKMAKTSPEKAAAIILRGMKKGKARILVGADARLLDRIQRLFPSGYPRFLRKMGGTDKFLELQAKVRQAATPAP
ncbi:MAG: SDR family oxidoreductase [Bacteroidetes bacterium]|nr:MAG: SDR family oxidoreductase [Bacteroidota bacterium]